MGRQKGSKNKTQETEPISNTGQTVQDAVDRASPIDTTPPSGKTPIERLPWFELSEDPDDGEWYWCLWSTNGKQMAISPIGYNQQNDCRMAVEVFNGQLGKKLKIAISHPG